MPFGVKRTPSITRFNAPLVVAAILLSGCSIPQGDEETSAAHALPASISRPDPGTAPVELLAEADQEATAAAAKAKRLEAEAAEKAARKAEEDRAAQEAAAVPAAVPVIEPAAQAAPASAPVVAQPASWHVPVVASGGQDQIDRCIGPVHFTPLSGYGVYITEHDFCGGWARFSGMSVGETVNLAGFGTYTVQGVGTVPQGGSTADVVAQFGYHPAVILQTCIPGTTSMRVIALG